MKPKYILDKKDPWMLAEDIPDMDMFFSQIFITSFVNDSSYPFIKNYKKILGIYKGFHNYLYSGKKDSYDVAESILKALIERPNFGKDLNKNIITWSNKLINFANKISKFPIKKYSNKQLWEICAEQDRIHTKLYTYGWLPVSVDMFHGNFTTKLKSYLYSICDTKEEAEQAFVIFTTPSKRTIIAEEREDFLKIYEKYKKFLKSRTIPQSLKDELKDHAKRWGHFGYIYSGNVEPFGSDHYSKELLELAKTGVDGKSLLKKESIQLKEGEFRKRKLFKKLKISPLYRRLFEIANDFALTKLYRRHAQLQDLYTMHTTVLEEIAIRLKLKRTHVQFMLTDEIKEALLKNKYNRKEFDQRLRHCTLYAERGFEKVYTGAAEKKIIATAVHKIDKNVKEFSGQTAQPGYAKGKVKIIIRAKDMPKMNKGDILVSIATDVDVVPAMKKAAAIVTEQGGITSHAAIVSRELGIPCIIGTKIATKVLKDGDMVEVDANKGIVRKIK